jgi:2-aminobenzoate-CoA ligase
MGEHREDGPAGGNSPASIVVQRRIEWSDTDASGNYHNSAVFRLIEIAETALLDRLGLLQEAYGRLPRAHISADFFLPLRFKDLIDVAVTVSAVGRSSVTYRFEISALGEVAASGKFVAVLLAAAGGKPVPWSDEHRDLLLTGGPQRPELLVEG